LAHPEVEWPLQQNILIFIFSYFIIFLLPLADNFGRAVTTKSSIGVFVFMQGARHSENLHLINNTEFANCAM